MVGLTSAVWAQAPGEGGGVTAPQAAAASDVDPLESFNRAVFRFNRGFDRAVLRPVARGYERITPEPVRRGVTNFFDNLAMPIDVVNSLLQAKGRKSAEGAVRFFVNSTVGILGVFDVASEWGLEPPEEDLGQTLAVWGVQDGPYLVLPFLGPATVRDGVGMIGDAWLHPLYHVEDDGVRYGALALRVVNTRANLLPLDQTIETAFDPYLFVREAYLQRREYLIHDGEPPVEYYDLDAYGDDASEAPSPTP